LAENEIAQRVGQPASDDEDYLRLTGVMTEARVSGRSDLDTGEAGDGRSNAPMDVAMEMATAATPVAAETAGTTIVEPMERNENGKRRRRSEAVATAVDPSDWRSRMERTMRQQAQELTQLHRTVGHLTNLLEAQAAREEAQWRGMMTWMQEREQKWGTRHKDDNLWGAGITNMIAKVVKGVAPGQEAREKERDKTARMDGGGLEASQHAATTQEGGPEKHQQLLQQPKPRLQLKLQPNPQHEPKPKSAPTPARRWETVPPCAQSQRAPVGPGPAPTDGSSMAERRLILRRDEGVPPPNTMDREVASAINRALFHQKALAHIRIMNAKRNARGTITAITHQNPTAAMALIYRDVIITARRTVDKEVIDEEENESWERLKIHAVPLVRYMGKGTEGLQKMREEFEPENEGIKIPTQVRWLANPRIIRERRQNGEIAASSVVFVVKESKAARRLVKNGIKAAGVWYRVETYTNAGPNSRCELCCGWGHIENTCGNKPTCGYCSGHHRTGDHKCNVVGCTAKQGSLCSHTLEKCPNCKGNHIVFSNRCAKKTEAARAARHSRKIGQAGQAPTGATTGVVSGTNRVALGPRPKGTAAEGGVSEGEMADVEEKEATGEAEDVTMTENANTTATAIGTETGAQATND